MGIFHPAFKCKRDERASLSRSCIYVYRVVSSKFPLNQQYKDIHLSGKVLIKKSESQTELRSFSEGGNYEISKIWHLGKSSPFPKIPEFSIPLRIRSSRDKTTLLTILLSIQILFDGWAMLTRKILNPFLLNFKAFTLWYSSHDFISI